MALPFQENRCPGLPSDVLVRPLARLSLGWALLGDLGVILEGGGLGRGVVRRPWCARGGERREADTSSGSWGGRAFFVIAGFGGAFGSEPFTRLGVCSTFSFFVQGGLGGTKDSGACTVGSRHSWVRRGSAYLVLYVQSRRPVKEIALAVLPTRKPSTKAPFFPFALFCALPLLVLSCSAVPWPPWRSPLIPWHVRGGVDRRRPRHVMGGSRFWFQLPPREV